jgi:hypothetical protein
MVTKPIIKNAIDCRSTEGVTIGLIDSIMTAVHVLDARDLGGPNIKEALKDLASDNGLKRLIAIGDYWNQKETADGG